MRVKVIICVYQRSSVDLKSVYHVLIVEFLAHKFIDLRRIGLAF